MGDGVKMEMWRTTRGGHFLRGPSGATGSSTTIIQVSKHLVIVPGGGGLAAALSQHEGDADDLLGLGQVAEHQAPHLCQAVAEGGLDVRICVLVKYKKAFVFLSLRYFIRCYKKGRCLLLLS
jgi:hypothetical protein